MQQVLAARREVTGGKVDSTLRTMRNLGLVHADLQQMDEAEALLREAVTTGRTALSSTNFLLGELQCSLGVVLGKRGKNEEAESNLLEGHAWLARTLGPDKPATRRAAGEVTAFYRRLGRLDEAATWEAKTQGQ
jgi:hypothetical protein